MGSLDKMLKPLLCKEFWKSMRKILKIENQYPKQVNYRNIKFKSIKLMKKLF